MGCPRVPRTWKALERKQGREERPVIGRKTQARALLCDERGLEVESGQNGEENMVALLELSQNLDSSPPSPGYGLDHAHFHPTKATQ